MATSKTELLKVIVGSKAHGLARPDSDTDYRAVYVLPTQEILSLGYNYKGSSWTEGEEDNTAYEIGHFLQLALKNNASILEVFKAPIHTLSNDGFTLRGLFKYVYNPQQAYNAFTGYSFNQRKKMLDKKDNRENKYATAYIRTLYNLCELLETGDFNVKITDPIQVKALMKLKFEPFNMGYVIDLASELQKKAELLLPNATSEYNPEKINDFLIDIRKRYW